MSAHIDPKELARDKAAIVQAFQEARQRIRPPGLAPMTEEAQRAPTEPPPAEQWPKACSCGRSYTEHEWRLLRFVGRMIDVVDDLELRDCRECRSTISQPAR